MSVRLKRIMDDANNDIQKKMRHTKTYHGVYVNDGERCSEYYVKKYSSVLTFPNGIADCVLENFCAECNDVYTSKCKNAGHTFMTCYIQENMHKQLHVLRKHLHCKQRRDIVAKIFQEGLFLRYE